MLRRLFGKYRGAKLYLGNVTVVPRKDVKRHLDEWGVFGRVGRTANMEA